MRDKEYEASSETTHKLFYYAEVRDREELFAQAPDGWKPKHLLDRRRVVEGA